MNNWHALDIVDVLQNLKTDATAGLDEGEAARRLAEFGPNELVERGSKSPWRILWEQLTATMVFLTLTFTQMAHVLAVRSEHDSLFRIGLLSNKALLAAVALKSGDN